MAVVMVGGLRALLLLSVLCQNPLRCNETNTFVWLTSTLITLAEAPLIMEKVHFTEASNRLLHIKHSQNTCSVEDLSSMNMI